MSRKDGRTSHSIRPLAISQSLLSRADGSAKFSFGNVSVIASVNGPSEVRIREELVDKATLEINVIPLRGLPGPSTKQTESFLLSLLTPLLLLSLYPRSLIQLTVQTHSSPSTSFLKLLSTDPSSSTKRKPQSTTSPSLSEKACQLNASTLAMLDASIESKGLVLSVAVGYLSLGSEEEEEAVLDPTPEEEENCKSEHLFVFSFGKGVGDEEGDCVGVESRGLFNEDQLFEAQELAREATKSILLFVRKSVEVRYGVKSGGGGVGKKGKKEEHEDVEMEE